VNFIKYSVEFLVPIVISSFLFLILCICVRMHLSSLLLIPDVEFNYLVVADSSTYEIISSRISKTLSVFLLTSLSLS
jgi:hypothetical protein